MSTAEPLKSITPNGAAQDRPAASIVVDHSRLRAQRAIADAKRDARVPRDIDRLMADTERKLDLARAKFGPAYAVLLWRAASGLASGGAAYGAGHGDPTFNAAVARIAQGTEQDHRIDANMNAGELLRARASLIHTAITELERDLSRLIRLAPPLAAEAYRVERCNGGRGFDGDWVNASCERTAVTTDGLCDPCRQARGRWLRKQEMNK